MFVLKASRSSTSMARVRQWLVLLLRILALLVFIVAIARPLLGGWLGWQLSGTPDTVIILIDRSATMGTAYGDGKNCLAQGVELLVKAGQDVAGDSRIILIDNVEMKGKQIPDWAVLSKIAETKVTKTFADVPAMFRTALDYMLKNGTGVTEVWVVSDLQNSNWQAGSSEWTDLEAKFKALSQPVTFKILAIKSNKTGNRSIALLDTLAYKTSENKNVHELVFSITSEEENNEKGVPLVFVNNGMSQQINVKLDGDYSRFRQRVVVPEKGKIYYGYIKLPADSNLQDNRLYFAYGDVIDSKVLVYSENTFLGDIFEAAAAPEGNKDKVVRVDNLSDMEKASFSAYSLIIWNGDYPTGKLEEKLMSYLDDAGAVIFFPLQDANANQNKKAKNHWNNAVTFPPDKPGKVAEWNRTSGPLADTASGSALPVDSLKILKRSTLAGSLADASALCADGRPFLYSSFVNKQGKLYFCTTLPVPEWSNLGDGVVLVPMLKRMQQEGEKRFAKITFSDCGTTGNVNHDSLPYPLSFSPNPAELNSANPIYDTGVFFKDQKFLVVNRPIIEDFRGSLADDDVKSLFKNCKIYLFNESSENDSAMQTEIWRWFLIAMFCFLVAESFLLAPGKQVLEMEKKP